MERSARQIKDSWNIRQKMYVTDPFLFWVFVKASVIIHRVGGGLVGWGFFLGGSDGFRGNWGRIGSRQQSTEKSCIENWLPTSCHGGVGVGETTLKYYRDLREGWGSFYCDSIEGSRIFHFLAKIFKYLSFSCRYLQRSFICLSKSFGCIYKR